MPETETMDRKISPEISIPEKIVFERPETRELDNGINLIIIREGSEEVVRTEFIFPSGAADYSGYLRTSTAHKLIDSGIPGMDSEQIADAFDFYGSYIQTSVTPDHKSITLFSLGKYLPRTTELAVKLIRSAEYPEDEVRDHIIRSMQSLQVNREKVSWIARSHFNELIFGKDSPVGHILQESDLDTIERTSLILNREQGYNWSEAHVIVAGKLDDAQLNEFIKILEELPAGDKISDTDHSFIHDEQGPARLRIEKEDALQCGVRIGKRLFNKLHPDYPGITVVNTILGGYFGSRLMSNIREDKGYTYGIGSAVISQLHSGTFFIASEIGKQVVDDAVREIYRELEILASEKVKDDELDLVRNYMLGALQRSVDGPFAKADSFKSLILWGLDTNFFSSYVEQIKTITPDDVKLLTISYLDPGSMTEVIAG
jgi:predicted Zn-dependent peptidase